MATLTSGYRDGTSEKAKRHARMRAAELKRMEAKAAKLATNGTVDGGHGACTMDLSMSSMDFGSPYLEVQVHPELLKVYLCGRGYYRSRRAEWVGREAAAIGLALCKGELPHDIFADWCEGNTPSHRDQDWDVIESMRNLV